MRIYVEKDQDARQLQALVDLKAPSSQSSHICANQRKALQELQLHV